LVEVLYIELKDINNLVKEIEKIGSEITTQKYFIPNTPNFINYIATTTNEFEGNKVKILIEHPQSRLPIVN